MIQQAQPRQNGSRKVPLSPGSGSSSTEILPRAQLRFKPPRWSRFASQGPRCIRNWIGIESFGDRNMNGSPLTCRFAWQRTIFRHRRRGRPFSREAAARSAPSAAVLRPSTPSPPARARTAATRRPPRCPRSRPSWSRQSESRPLSGSDKIVLPSRGRPSPGGGREAQASLPMWTKG